MENKVNEIQEDYGSRASKTESLVYRILQTPRYRTVEIVGRFLDAAIVAGDKSNLRWRAQNIVDRMKLYPETGIPKTAFDLVVWSDLAVTASIQTKAKSAYKAVPRKFIECLGCSRRFLAKRANNLTCSARCRLRAHRKSAMKQIPEMTLPIAA
jgi:hypothetical protein